MRTTWSDYERWLGDTAINFRAPDVAAPEPSHINRDSRTLKANEMFLALKGDLFDGHGFINSAMELGASCFIYEDRTKIAPQYLDRGIQVTDCLVALQRIGKGHLQRLKCQKIAITGSVGKTTCKQMLESILKGAGSVHVSPESYNNEIGVPLTMLGASHDHQFVVFECGARHVGDIKFLVEMIEPDVAVVLNAGKAHIAEFGSLQQAIDTKLEMFRHAPKCATLVTNMDQPEVFELAGQLERPIISFGFDSAADISVSRVDWLDSGLLQFELRVAGRSLVIDIPDGNEALAINGAAAAAISSALEVGDVLIKAGLEAFRSGRGRFQVHDLPKFKLVDDAYNASPASMVNGFRSCQRKFGRLSKTVVLGDMLELGDESAALHSKIGRECFDILQPDLLITVGNASRNIAQGAVEAGMKKDRVQSFDNVEQVVNLPAGVLSGSDLVYIKGSNSIRLSLLVKHLTEAKHD